ncbi:MAG: chorismate synthase [Muribaculaceae bacterium]|nr:chorismate synthase [Muribaculaceae bacterium]
MNSFGRIYRLTTFGESHGPAVGGIIDGCPAGFCPDFDEIARQMARRCPGAGPAASHRQESDAVQFLSGLFDGRTTGTPIAFAIANGDARSRDYSQLQHAFRPSHADYSYTAKYGLRDYRGGGRASARETAARMVGGALAMQLLKREGISIKAYTSQIAAIRLPQSYRQLDLSDIDGCALRCPDATAAAVMLKAVEQARAEGDTLGGVVSCVISGVPAGLGEPVFGKLQASLAAAMLGIPAAKGFDYGMGFDDIDRRGSEVLDLFAPASGDGMLHTLTNHSGGIQGGISNGEDIYFRVAFKPVATMMRPVPTVDDSGNEITLSPSGRHDVCVVPRAVPVVEAMAAMTVLDALLIKRCNRL